MKRVAILMILSLVCVNLYSQVVGVNLFGSVNISEGLNATISIGTDGKKIVISNQYSFGIKGVAEVGIEFTKDIVNLPREIDLIEYFKNIGVPAKVEKNVLKSNVQLIYIAYDGKTNIYETSDVLFYSIKTNTKTNIEIYNNENKNLYFNIDEIIKNIDHVYPNTCPIHFVKPYYGARNIDYQFVLTWPWPDHKNGYRLNLDSDWQVSKDEWNRVIGAEPIPNLLLGNLESIKDTSKGKKGTCYWCDGGEIDDPNDYGIAISILYNNSWKKGVYNNTENSKKNMIFEYLNCNKKYLIFSNDEWKLADE